MTNVPTNSCRINFVSGRPTPTVSWFINDRLVEGHLEAIGNHVIVNRLGVTGVKRELLNSSYKCQASNTKLMMPVEKTVRLELLRKFCLTCFIRQLAVDAARKLCVDVMCVLSLWQQGVFAACIRTADEQF